MANFEIAIKLTLQHEGGLSDDPEDHGGLTKFGISKASFPDLDIKNLTLEKAKDIYKKNYWDKVLGDKILDQALANKIFDIAVNCGVFVAVKNIQRAIMSLSRYFIAIDGRMGPQTLNTINLCDPIELLKKFREFMEKHYESLNQPRFIKGWLRRLYDN